MNYLLIISLLIGQCITAISAEGQIRITGLQDSIIAYENRLWVKAFDVEVCDTEGLPAANVEVRLEVIDNSFQTALISPWTSDSGKVAGLLYGFIPERVYTLTLVFSAAEDSLVKTIEVIPRPGPDRIEILWADTVIWAETGQRAQAACRIHISNYKGEPAAGAAVIFETLQSPAEVLSEAWTDEHGDLNAAVQFPADWFGQAVIRAAVVEPEPLVLTFPDTGMTKAALSSRFPAHLLRKGRLDLTVPIRKWTSLGQRERLSEPHTRLNGKLNQTATWVMMVNHIAPFSAQANIPNVARTARDACLAIQGLKLKLQVEPEEVYLDSSSFELIAITAQVRDSAGNLSNGIPVQFSGSRTMFAWWDSVQERFRYFYPLPPIRMTGEDGKGLAQVFLLGLTPALFRDRSAQAMILDISAQIGYDTHIQIQRTSLICRRRTINTSPSSSAD